MYVVVQENGTLPVGPIETNKMWYAGARPGYTTLTAIVWGALPKQYYTYVSRVMEKAVEYPLAILYDLVPRLRLDANGVTDLQTAGW